MGKEKAARTRHFHNMFEISSLIQKAIRRRDANLAYYAANELVPKFRNYLWKRLLTVSAEDCFDMITGRIVELRRMDDNHQDNKYIAIAVSTLLNARKNRDADYYACNLLNSRDTADISKYVSEPVRDDTCATKNGHCMFDLAICLRRAIDEADDVMAGYAANELLVYYPKFCWKTLIMKAQEMGYPEVVSEIRALSKIGELTKGGVTFLPYAKAITILLKVAKYKSTDFYLTDFIYNDKIDLSQYDNVQYQIPDYVYDCHTYKGKAMKRTKEMFIRDEQAALVPLHEGEYDHASWEHHFWLCDNGFYREDYTPHPSKERMKELESGIVQLTLFGNE